MDKDQALKSIMIKLGILDKDDYGEYVDPDTNPEYELISILCEDAYNYMYVFFDCDPKSNYNSAPPAQLQFVIESVVIKRYRRIGAEGIAIEKIDVLSTTYESGDDFAEYISIMNQYKRRIGRDKGPRGFRFL